MSNSMILNIVQISVFVVLFIIAFIFGLLEKKMKERKDELKTGKHDLNKEVIKLYVQPTNLLYLIMITIAALVSLMFSYYILNNIDLNAIRLSVLISILAITEITCLVFIIIYLVRRAKINKGDFDKKVNKNTIVITIGKKKIEFDKDNFNEEV